MKLRDEISSRLLIESVTISIGAGTVCFLDVLALLASPRHEAVFHLDSSPATVFIPALVDTLAVALLFTFTLLLSSFRARLHRIVCAGILCFLPWTAYRNVLSLHAEAPTLWISRLFLLFSGIAFALIAALPGVPLSRAYAATWTIGRGVLLVCGFVAGITLLQVSFYGVEANGLNTTKVLPHAAATVRPRVIWIILDELGYSQLYGSRLPELLLPNFDQLAAQSTVFTDTIPAAGFTDAAIPSLLTGKPVYDVSHTANGRALFIKNAQGTHLLDTQSTTFADAQTLGYHVGVVGWYIPYCRLFGLDLDSCVWAGHGSLSPIYPSRTIMANIVSPVVRIREKLWHSPLHGKLSQADFANGTEHSGDYKQLQAAAVQAINTPDLSFVLLHLPVPHPGGIWDRRTESFAIGRSSYVDNLALADRFLGIVHDALTASGEWDSATIVVMGDHGWRTRELWIGAPGWSAEDQRASNGGEFDPRPAYIVKLPAQRTSAILTTSFKASRTRSLLDALLRHSIPTPDALRMWAELGAN